MKKLANLLLGLYCFWGTAQKPLDSIAYEQWERIVSPQIAYNGKWIAYQKVFQDETRTSEPSCFFVSTTGREMRKLDSTSSVSFVGTENWVLYNKNEKPVLYNPENQEKRQLKTSSYVADIPGTNWLYYSEYSPQNTEGTSTLVFYHIESGKSISYSHIQSYKILDGQHILFSQIENDKIALQYGKIAGGALSTVYTGYSKDFGGFGMTNNFEGTYITVEGNNHLLHYFNLKEQSSHIVLDFSKINLDDSHYLPVQRTYPISKNTRFILLDVNSSFGENNFQKQGKKTSDAEVWKWDEELTSSSYVADIPGTNWLYYSEYSPQNTEGTSTLVFYHIESGKSISYSHIQSYKILDGQHILFSQIENDKIALQYGKIAGGALSTVYTGYSKDFGGFGMTNNFEGTYITV